MRCNNLVYLLTLLFSAGSIGGVSADEGAVREAIKAYVAAFNARDLSTLEKLWSEKAVHVDEQSGERTEGRAQIIQDIKTVFENSSVLNLAGSIDQVRLVKEDVATISGDVSLSVGSDPILNQFSAILLKQNGTWVIDSMEEREVVQPPSAADAMVELDWLVGKWQDAENTNPVQASVKLAIGGSFLVRSFEATTAEGTPLQSTQIIGWDPRAQQFRSWTFDADGSFGDGVWTKSDNQWLIKSTQTLADGRAASGTYVMTMQDADSFTVQLIGREIEGELQPASNTVTVKRVVKEAVSSAAPTR